MKLKFASYSHIALPYRISSRGLRVYSRAPRQELQAFLGFLNGTTIVVQDCTHYYLVNSRTEEIFALWRALRVVPFRGELLTVSVDWEPMVGVKAAPSRVVVEHKQQQPLTITRKGDTVVPPKEIRNSRRMDGRTGRRNCGRKVPALNQVNFPSFENLAAQREGRSSMVHKQV
jgi:hypothetical protein